MEHRDPPRAALPPRGHERRRSGNWAVGEHGRFWGRHGAAGLLIQNPRGEVLLQLRAEWCDHGGTWGIPGGAREPHETALAAALREAGEEHAGPVHDLRVTGSHVVDHGYWSYVTFLAIAPRSWSPGAESPEVLAAQWVPPASIGALALHPGLALSWPRLEALLPLRPSPGTRLPPPAG
ncbi:NUDIX domain-containing protein [Leucobacter sp.]